MKKTIKVVKERAIREILNDADGKLTLDQIVSKFHKAHKETITKVHCNNIARRWEVETGKKFLRKRDTGEVGEKKLALFELYSAGVPARKAFKIVGCWPNYARLILEEWEAIHGPLVEKK